MTVSSNRNMLECNDLFMKILRNFGQRFWVIHTSILGLYIVRGDNVAVIGEVDEEIDQSLALADIKAQPLNAVVH